MNCKLLHSEEHDLYFLISPSRTYHCKRQSLNVYELIGLTFKTEIPLCIYVLTSRLKNSVHIIRFCSHCHKIAADANMVTENPKCQIFYFSHFPDSFLNCFSLRHTDFQVVIFKKYACVSVYLISNAVVVQSLSHVQIFVTLWTTATRIFFPSLSPWVRSNSCPLSQWYHPTISSSLAPFSTCPQFFLASGSFPMNWLFPSGGQSIGVSASVSVLPMNIQGWFPLGLTSLISLQSKGVSRVFSSTTVGKHQFFSAQPFYGPALTFIHDYWKNHSFDYTDLCWQKDTCIYVCIRR